MKKSAEAGPESSAFFAASSARFGVLFAKVVLYNGAMKNLRRYLYVQIA
jgi:hypothetical protein